MRNLSINLKANSNAFDQFVHIKQTHTVYFEAVSVNLTSESNNQLSYPSIFQLAIDKCILIKTGFHQTAASWDQFQAAGNQFKSARSSAPALTADRRGEATQERKQGLPACAHLDFPTALSPRQMILTFSSASYVAWSKSKRLPPSSPAIPLPRDGETPAAASSLTDAIMDIFTKLLSVQLPRGVACQICPICMHMG